MHKIIQEVDARKNAVRLTRSQASWLMGVHTGDSGSFMAQRREGF